MSSPDLVTLRAVSSFAPSKFPVTSSPLLVCPPLLKVERFLNSFNFLFLLHLFATSTTTLSTASTASTILLRSRALVSRPVSFSLNIILLHTIIMAGSGERMTWDHHADHDLLTAMILELQPTTDQLRGIMNRMHGFGHSCTVKAITYRLSGFLIFPELSCFQ